MIIAFTGGREFKPTIVHERLLALILIAHRPVVVHGACPHGADVWVDARASMAGCEIVRYPPRPSYGPKELCARNYEIVKHRAYIWHGTHTTPLDVRTLVAFPGGPGTRHCVQAAQRIGIPVVHVSASLSRADVDCLVARIIDTRGRSNV